MNDLEWLARNVHEWGGDDEFPFIFKDSIGCEYAEEPDGDIITRAQWQAERDRISGKPIKWINDWAEYRAQDSGGKWFEFDLFPIANGVSWGIVGKVYTAPNKGEVLGYWGS